MMEMAIAMAFYTYFSLSLFNNASNLIDKLYNTNIFVIKTAL
jgi:hypothetical protein